MVLVPAGPFEVGDDASGVLEKGGFRGRGGGPLLVASEEPLTVGGASGLLHYEPGETPQYIGDGMGPVPAAYPKGTRAFYVMKYELRQGEYARFLNALPEAWREQHAPDLSEDVQEAATCSIVRSDEGFVAAAPLRPCNFVTWTDTAAWTDWMALRPMTELEFEKAARGPQRPMSGDFPWGNDSREGVERRVLPSRDLAAARPEDEAALDDDTRVRLAASYYWVFDLSGSLWERVISAGHPAGRAFRGTHGDGQLIEGRATNDDWPRQVDRDAPGIGYRGGADYFSGEPNETNPFSCVATRQYAAWSGAYRYKTYSARAVRTAPR
jgi:formylglycine-generating enzyme required for sulfatase activity